MKTPMGSIPVERVTPSFAFEHSSCDIFGPFQVRLVGKFTRQRKNHPGYTKAYGLILTCLSTRAVHIEAMQGQNTDSFLLAFRRFISIRGQPKSMYSDCGGQLIAADDELKTLVAALDHEKIQQYGAVSGMHWTYSSPGSPWQNGVTESLIKSVKKTLKTIIDPQTKIPILELQTVFYEVAEILNERPLSLSHHGASGSDFDSDTSSYLCPNDLLLGRCTTRIPAGPFTSAQVSSEERLLAIQTIVTDFWKKWTEFYLPTLIYQSKWFTYSRPASVGDIVDVRDLNPIRGDWNIAEVVEVRSNDDEKAPINVLLRYKTVKRGKDYQPATDRFQWRDVKNLVLILGADERTELNVNAPEFVPTSKNN